MRKVIQHESKTYLAPMPVVEKPDIPDYQHPDSFESIVSKEKYYNESTAYINWLKEWIECTGFEIGQEVPEGEWEMRARVCGVHCFPVDTDQVCNGYCMNKALFPPKVAIPKQQPEREEETAAIEKMADETCAASEAIEFAEWLRENNMSPNGFGGWGGGHINVNHHGSSTVKLYQLFKSKSLTTRTKE